jgi:RNA polymerase sigma-70 factor (ECF subfamily)
MLPGNERSDRPEAPGGAGDYFATTRWTVVVSAGKQDSPHAQQALEELCETYWYPLYVYVRRQGQSKEDAEDLTQGFFARFLRKNYIETLDSNRGKFRAYLLASLKHFLASEWEHARRQKRGGDAVHLSLDWQTAEARYQGERADHLSPDRIYDREWALTLLERVIQRLKEECRAEGKERLFEELKGALTADRDRVGREAATKLGMQEGALRVAVHRLRRRYRELLREEIAQTLADKAQVDEELRALQEALRN